jgi:hypothetical protein
LDDVVAVVITGRGAIIIVFLVDGTAAIGLLVTSAGAAVSSRLAFGVTAEIADADAVDGCTDRFAEDEAEEEEEEEEDDEDDEEAVAVAVWRRCCLEVATPAASPMR